MRNLRAIYRRELAAAFQNPGLYVVAGFFLFLISSIVTEGLFDYARKSTETDPLLRRETVDFTQSVVTGSFGAVSILFVFVVPIVTMRAFAEERRSGMTELLSSWPVTNWEWILGKFLSLVTTLLILDAILGVYLLVFCWLGDPDAGVMLTCSLGVALITFAYVALGLFASSLTENQIVAAIVTFVALFFFWIIQNFGAGGDSLFARICDALSVSTRFANFAKGHVSLYDALYFVLFTAFWLFMTARALEARRWQS